MSSNYMEATQDLYREAAITPQDTLCCASATPFALPGLVVPEEMTAMNYGCGTTVNVRDLKPDMNVLYVGVGGGLEALQFAYLQDGLALLLQLIVYLKCWTKLERISKLLHS